MKSTHLPIHPAHVPVLERLEPRLLLDGYNLTPGDPIALCFPNWDPCFEGDESVPISLTLSIVAVDPSGGGQEAVYGGDVTVRVVRGNLVITGDALDNAIMIDQSGLGDGEFRITAMEDSGTTINGQTEAIVLTGVTGGLRVSLGDGDDSLDIHDAIVSGDLGINTGRGWDDVSIESAAALSVEIEGSGEYLNVCFEEGYVHGDFAYTFSPARGGDSYLYMGGVKVGGAVVIDHGAGQHYIEIDSAEIGSGLKVNNRGGYDWGYEDFGSFEFHLYDSTVQGDIVVSNADFSSWLDIGDCQVDGRISIDSRGRYDPEWCGFASFDLSVYDSRAGGDLSVSVTTSDTSVDLSGLSVGGDILMSAQGSYSAGYGSFTTADVSLSEVDAAGDLSVNVTTSDTWVDLSSLSVGGDLLISAQGSYSADYGSFTTADVYLSEVDAAGNLSVSITASDTTIALDGLNVGASLGVTVRGGYDASWGHTAADICIWDVEVVGDVTVDAANSETWVDLSGISVGGSLPVSVRGGYDAWYESYTVANICIWDVEVVGDVTVDAANSEASVDLGGIGVGGSLAVTVRGGYYAGDECDYFTTADVSLGSGEIAGDVDISIVKSDGYVEATDVSLGGDLAVSISGGDYSETYLADSPIAGTASITGQAEEENSVWLENVELGGDLAVATANVEDVIDIYEASTPGKVTASAGGSDEGVWIGDSQTPGAADRPTRRQEPGPYVELTWDWPTTVIIQGPDGTWITAWPVLYPYETVYETGIRPVGSGDEFLPAGDCSIEPSWLPVAQGPAISRTYTSPMPSASPLDAAGGLLEACLLSVADSIAACRAMPMTPAGPYGQTAGQAETIAMSEWRIQPSAESLPGDRDAARGWSSVLGGAEVELDSLDAVLASAI